ncbi:MAG: hypothetical protein ABA06_02255 [Parcubacteria bacterium C7867-001]|nr:MAG: hypothetical protein ABA06_02255 [Parcubacteria bacterium C7867-001]
MNMEYKQPPTTFDEATRLESEAAFLVRKNMDNSRDKVERSQETFALLKRIKAFVEPGWYEHFKSKPTDLKRYLVTGVEEQVNTGMCTVRYIADYGLYKGEPAHRELVGPDSFLRPVDRTLDDGTHYRGPRFRKIADPNEVHIG